MYGNFEVAMSTEESKLCINWISQQFLVQLIASKRLSLISTASVNMVKLKVPQIGMFTTTRTDTPCAIFLQGLLTHGPGFRRNHFCHRATHNTNTVARINTTIIHPSRIRR